jgi:HSP20 family protein
VDLKETDKEFVVKAELPGVAPKDLDIAVYEGVLTLKGEKKEEVEESKGGFHRTERFFGEFYRAIPLPPGCDEGKVVANCAKGVVTVTIPKKPNALPKKVEVKALE